MSTYSSFPGSVEFTAPQGGSIVDENLFGEISWLNLKLELVLIYGSLPRPPDIQSTVVCTCFLTLLSTNEESRTVDVVDDLAFWRYAHREGELRLDSFKKILEYGIDNGWLVMLLERPVFTSKTHSLELLSKECKEDSLILIFHLCKFTRLSLFIKILVGCSARLLFSVGERLKQEVYPHTFQDVVCVDIVSKRNILQEISPSYC
uniref:Uncharacterized protein n=1 Tax=Noccaea caerulescens TaxID=107243 RepID=A0A1J3J2W1_NOCCA